MPCLHKHKRHLFLEENDNNATNSFIVAVNSLQGAKDYIYLLAGHTDQIVAVGDNIDDVVNVSNNMPAINEANRNVPDIKSFNDNINNGKVNQFIKTFTDALDETSNKWAIRLTEIGESIIASADAYNYEAVTVINNNYDAGIEVILPEAMHYKPGTYMLIVSYNGALVYLNDGYNELGSRNDWSTRVKINFPLRAGDRLCFRTIGVSSNADTEGNLWVERLTAVGRQVAATLSATSSAYVYEVESEVAASTALTLPNEMKYKVGTFMLMLTYNGTVCYEGEQYYEVGTTNEWSTTINIRFNLRIGDKLGFRIIALADIAETTATFNTLAARIDDLYGILLSLTNSVEYIYNVLQLPTDLPEEPEPTEEPTEPTEPTDEPTGDNTEGTGGDNSGNDNEGNGGNNTNP